MARTVALIIANQKSDVIYSIEKSCQTELTLEYWNSQEIFEFFSKTLHFKHNVNMLLYLETKTISYRTIDREILSHLKRKFK